MGIQTENKEKKKVCLLDTNNKILPEHSACLLAGRSAALTVDMSGDSRAGSSVVRTAVSKVAMKARQWAVRLVACLAACSADWMAAYLAVDLVETTAGCLADHWVEYSVVLSADSKGELLVATRAVQRVVLSGRQWVDC